MTDGPTQANLDAVRKLAEREQRLHPSDFRWRNALAALTERLKKALEDKP